jgi:hypothetical protein
VVRVYCFLLTRKKPTHYVAGLENMAGGSASRRFCGRYVLFNIDTTRRLNLTSTSRRIHIAPNQNHARLAARLAHSSRYAPQNKNPHKLFKFNSPTGVVIGFVISYRAMSGDVFLSPSHNTPKNKNSHDSRYDRYWMGHTCWADVIQNSRAIARLIWYRWV